MRHRADDNGFSMNEDASAIEPVSVEKPSTASAFLLLQAIEFPVLVLKQDARVAWLNAAYERLFGFSASEVQDSHLWEHLVTPECADFARRNYRDCPEERTLLDMQKKNGKPAGVRWTNHLIVDAHQGTRYTVLTAPGYAGPVGNSSISTVADDSQVQSALQASEVRFQTLFDSAAEFIFVIDSAGKIMLTNRAVADQSGFSPDEITGKNIKDFFSEESKRLCDCNFPVLRERGYNRAQVEFVCKDGRGLQMECSATAIPDSNGRFTSFLVIQRDVTERQQAAKALADSERRFRAIFNSTFQFIGLLTPEGILLEANQAALDFVGASNDDVVGKPFWDTPWWSASAAEQDRLQAAIQKAAKGELIRYETEHVGVEGKVAAIDFSLKPVKNELGETVLIIPEGRDITERRRAEEAARHHQRESAHFMRLSIMGEMAAGMAHELNQPLAALISYCGTAYSMLADIQSVPADLVDMLRRAKEQAHRASDIIRHIRNFVAKGSTSTGPVDVDQVIVEMCSFLDWELRNSKVSINLDLDSQGRTVKANAVQIEQVLLNLIRNSLEAIHSARISSGQLTLKTRLLKGRSIRVMITDNGPGIDVNMCGRLFEPFHTNKETGMGMGLSISRSIIQAHQGKILLSKSDRNGTTFCIELPVFD
jgi:PAS domain S-box-containing protein